MTDNSQLRELPSVDEILQSLNVRCPRELLVAETRRVIDDLRNRLKRGEHVELTGVPERVLQNLAALQKPSLCRVINATGVVLHTNLGRAPLPRQSVQGYSNIEYDLKTGKRGKRDRHVSSLIERLTGSPAIVVNNNAAAVFLAVNELAAGGEAIISRGELIEIGDGFRVPDIMQRAGAVLREVGTTNRTHIEDYRNAINDKTKLIVRVHPSNFHMRGFVAKPKLEELAALSLEHQIPLYEDLGSGCLIDLKPYGIDEPVVADSLRAGVDLVSFSGDKLLGGPQAGILAGDADLIRRLRANPMFRAFRVDKLITCALENTLRQTLFCHHDQIPALRMIMTPAAAIRIRAEKLALELQGRAEVVEGHSVIGGGSTPEQSLPTWLVSIACEDVSAAESRLRLGDPAIVARIDNNRLVVDLRTVADDEFADLLNALKLCAF